MIIEGGRTASDTCRMAFLLALAWLLHWIQDSASSRVKSASIACQDPESYTSRHSRQGKLDAFVYLYTHLLWLFRLPVVICSLSCYSTLLPPLTANACNKSILRRSCCIIFQLILPAREQALPHLELVLWEGIWSPPIEYLATSRQASPFVEFVLHPLGLPECPNSGCR